MLWRRETDQVGSGKPYVKPQKIGANSVVIKSIDGFGGTDVVVYTHIATNIAPVTAKRLAALAIESARQRRDGREGISYLINAKASGIRTALSDAYEEEIKAALGVASLAEALEKLHPRV